MPKRELVDLLETTIDERRPDLVLLPYSKVYDQDHVTIFQTTFAVAQPIAEVFGKCLVPHMMTYEMTKLNWAGGPLLQPVAYCHIIGHLDAKLDAVRRYKAQFRPSSHTPSLESANALTSVRGKEIWVEYAEAFGMLRTTF